MLDQFLLFKKNKSCTACTTYYSSLNLVHFCLASETFVHYISACRNINQICGCVQNIDYVTKLELHVGLGTYVCGSVCVCVCVCECVSVFMCTCR